jgi:GNAT superfamily N-acetyltransferase
MNLYIRELQPGDKSNGLSLGKQEYIPLKTFLKKAALEFHQDNVAKTYVLVDQTESPQIWGYATLMCSEITLDGLKRLGESSNYKRYDTFPAIKLARLAVDKSLQGQGYGALLVKTTIAIAKDYIMPNVGCRFVTVDSKRNAVNFYEKIGFTLLESKENQTNQNPLMFLDLNKID